ncbi:MAG: hypothetical protein O6951_06375 [Actinobacteria bacterium]|nr:hypothetical protein [Actinomycetota bacterium]
MVSGSVIVVVDDPVAGGGGTSEVVVLGGTVVITESGEHAEPKRPSRSIVTSGLRDFIRIL